MSGQTDASAVATAPTLDVAVLNANTMSDIGLQRELFDLYFGQGPALFAELAASVETSDKDRWRAAAHGLKGTARTLGLIAFGECAADAEEASPSADRLTRLENTYAAASTAARGYIGAAEAAA